MKSICTTLPREKSSRNPSVGAIIGSVWLSISPSILLKQPDSAARHRDYLYFLMEEWKKIRATSTILATANIMIFVSGAMPEKYFAYWAKMYTDDVSPPLNIGYCWYFKMAGNEKNDIDAQKILTHMLRGRLIDVYLPAKFRTKAKRREALQFPGGAFISSSPDSRQRRRGLLHSYYIINNDLSPMNAGWYAQPSPQHKWRYIY